MQSSNRGRIHAVAMAAALAALTTGGTARAQDPTVRELIRKVEANEEEGGFCASVPWRVSTAESEHLFLENAAVGTAEAARFEGGQCSYTYVTQVYPGPSGKCVRYTWWACGPGKTCATGESLYCKSPSGEYERQ